MTNQMIRQTMFSMGQVDPVNWRRTDLSLYMQALQSGINCEIGTTALLQKRSGTTKLNNITNYCTATSRAFELVDKNGNFYMVLLSVGKIDIFLEDGSFYQEILMASLTAPILESLAYTNVNDSLVFTGSAIAPFRVYINYSPLVFVQQTLDIYPYPAYDFGNIDYNNFTVNLGVAGTTLTFQFTGLASDPGYTNEWIGGQIIGAGVDSTDPIGYAIITAVSAYAAGTVTFTATVQVPFLTAGYTPLGSQYSIRQPAFSATLGYPRVVNYYQNRLIFASTPTLPLTIFGSQINSPTNFDVGIGLDTDAIVYTLGNSDSGNIIAINSGKQLEIYTENFEFACPQDTNVALTPSTFAVRQQSAFGSSSLCMPVTYNNDSFYITKTGNAIMQYQFDGIGLCYTSTNVSMQSTTLVNNPINRALLRGSATSQDNFIYYLNQDYSMLAFQFAQEFNLAALTPIEFQDNVQVVDIVTINNQVYIIKYYSLTSQYILETMDETVNCDGCITVSIPSNGIVTGLDDLVGYRVNVFYDGQDYGDYTVDESGQITVKNKGNTGSAQVGLIYDVEIVPMYVYAGAMATDYYKNISKIFIDYFDSYDFFINGKQVTFQSFDDIQAGLPITPQSGRAISYPVQGWNQDYVFSITQSSPFDLTISAIAYQISAAII